MWGRDWDIYYGRPPPKKKKFKIQIGKNLEGRMGEKEKGGKKERRKKKRGKRREK